MTLKECYEVLGLAEDATLSDVKSAYRKLAFSLHPDLNPDLPGASRRFQELNEAYVTLSQTPGPARASRPGKEKGDAASTAKAREEAHQAYKKAQKGQAAPGAQGAGGRQDGGRPMDKEEVLKDILNDPFARRVFEDIYSHIRHETGTRSSREERSAGAFKNARQAQPGAGGSNAVAPEGQAAPRSAQAPEKSVLGGIKGWLRKQIDDEQVLRLPGDQLVPGARVRLQIQHGLSGEPQMVELTLPPEFTPGKAMRLKGMGRRFGSWRGDLYVRIEPA